jgi:hypothetical protein
VYGVIVTVRPQFADMNLSHVHAGREKPWPTVRELLSRPDYDPIHSGQEEAFPTFPTNLPL